MKKVLIPLVGVSLALAVAIPTIGATVTHDGSSALGDAPPSNLSVDIMYWTSIDPETGQPGGGCATVLAWQDNSKDERGFRIERRRADSATWQPIEEVAPETTEYKDLDVCGGSCYRVAAVGAGGPSRYSNEACYRPDGLAIASISVSPATEGCWPSPCVTPTSVTVTGTVMGVSLSARVITLAESVEGFDVVALTEQTRLVSPSGGEATLQGVRPGMRIEASGGAGESGALLAEVVRILSDEAPAPVDAAAEPSDTDVVDCLYEVTVRFNTSVTQDDIDDVSALLRAHDPDLEFAIMESWPPIGRAVLTNDATDFCPTVEAELGAKTYVDDVSCEPWEEPGQGEPGTTVVTSNETSGPGNSTAAQYELTVQFNSSATQNDIEEVEALLRTHDQDAELLMTFCFPPMGTAIVTTDAPDTVAAELETRSYVNKVSWGRCSRPRCGPEEPAPVATPLEYP